MSVFTVVNVTALVLRRDRVDHDHFTAPSVIPALGALVSIALLADTLIGDPAVGLRAVLLLAGGALLYLVNRLVISREAT